MSLCVDGVEGAMMKPPMGVAAPPPPPADDHPDLYIPEEVKHFLPYFEFQIGAKVCDIENKNFFNLISLSLSLSLSLRTQERYWLFMRTNSIAYLIVSSRSSPGRRVTVSPS